MFIFLSFNSSARNSIKNDYLLQAGIVYYKPEFVWIVNNAGAHGLLMITLVSNGNRPEWSPVLGTFLLTVEIATVASSTVVQKGLKQGKREQVRFVTLLFTFIS